MLFLDSLCLLGTGCIFLRLLELIKLKFDNLGCSFNFVKKWFYRQLCSVLDLQIYITDACNYVFYNCYSIFYSFWKFILPILYFILQGLDISLNVFHLVQNLIYIVCGCAGFFQSTNNLARVAANLVKKTSKVKSLLRVLYYF